MEHMATLVSGRELLHVVVVIETNCMSSLQVHIKVVEGIMLESAGYGCKIIWASFLSGCLMQSIPITETSLSYVTTAALDC